MRVHGELIAAYPAALPGSPDECTLEIGLGESSGHLLDRKVLYRSQMVEANRRTQGLAHQVDVIFVATTNTDHLMELNGVMVVAVCQSFN